MTDRQKIIKAIEICYTPGNICTECPFFHEEECNNDLMRDALELLKDDETQLIYRDEIIKAHEDEIERLNKLLKEQEPRVMTLDEAASAQEVWVEAWISVPKKIRRYGHGSVPHG